MKKSLAAMLAAPLILSFTACGGDDELDFAETFTASADRAMPEVEVRVRCDDGHVEAEGNIHGLDENLENETESITFISTVVPTEGWVKVVPKDGLCQITIDDLGVETYPDPPIETSKELAIRIVVPVSADD